MFKSSQKTIIVCLFTTFLACKKNDPAPTTAPLSTTESNTVIDGSISSFNADAATFSSATSFKTLRGLSSANDLTTNGPSTSSFSSPTFRVEAGSTFSTDFALSLIKMANFIPSSYANARVDSVTLGQLAKIAGEYDWSSSLKGFPSKPNRTSTSLVFNFPDSTNKAKNAANNCKLTLSDFEFQEITKSGKTKKDTLPTKVTMLLEVNGVTEMSFAFTATYNQNEDPLSLMSTLFVNPYTITETAAYSPDGSTATTGFDFKNGSNGILGYSITANGNIQNRTYTTGSLEMYVYDLGVKSDINVKALVDEGSKSNGLSDATINQYLVTKMYKKSTGATIGNLIYKTEQTSYDCSYYSYTYQNGNYQYVNVPKTCTSNNFAPYLVYTSDNSTKLLKDWAKDFVEKISIPGVAQIKKSSI